MSWLYSQALVEEYLEANSLDGELSAPLSGNHIPQAYCAQDKMMEFSRLSQYGMTFAPLTDIPGEELLMSSVVDFHVRTLVHQVKVQELKEKEAECGSIWRASFVKYNLHTHSWKTHQCSLLEDLESYSGIWPQWGLMLNGECWEQKNLVHHIQEKEFGLSLGTPLKSDNMRLMFKKKSTLKATYGSHVNSLPYWTCANHGKIPSLQLYHWMMDWPNGWTQLQPLGMDKFQLWQQQHGNY